MSIPFVSDIIDGIKWLIDFFFHKAPKPLLFVFFLLLLATISLFLSTILHLMGYHCYSGAGSGLQVVKVDTTEFKANWDIWTASDEYVKGNSLTICEAHPEVCGKESNCYSYAKYNTSNYYYFYQACDEANPEPNCKFILKTDYDCNNCTIDEACFEGGVAPLVFGLVTCTRTTICDPNYNAIGLEDIPFNCGLKYRVENSPDNCWIPPNYEWNTDTGEYDCLNLAVCGDNATIQSNKRVNQLLNSVGFETIYYDDISGRIDIDSAVYLKCNKNLNPEVTVYGLPVFNYQVWVFLFLIGALVGLLFKLGQQHQ